MKHTKKKGESKMRELQQGDSVIVTDGGKEVKGYIENFQKHPAEKVNVHIIHPGHPKHGLIVAFDHRDVTLDEEEQEKAQSA